MSELSTTSTASLDRARLSRRLSLTSLATIVLGIASGLVWLWLANPAQWEARQGGIVLTEVGARGQFAVIVTFVVIAIVVSTAFGWGLVRALPDLGWLLVPLSVILTVLTGLIAWRVGVELGPPPPASVTGVSVGDMIPDQLAIDGLAPFLVWPIFGLAGVIGATWASERGRSTDVVAPAPEPVA